MKPNKPTKLREEIIKCLFLDKQMTAVVDDLEALIRKALESVQLEDLKKFNNWMIKEQNKQIKEVLK